MKRLFFLLGSYLPTFTLYSSEICFSIIKKGKNICCSTQCKDTCFNMQASLAEHAKTFVRTYNITGKTIKHCITSTTCLLCSIGCVFCCEAFLFTECPDNTCIISHAQREYGCSPKELSDHVAKAGIVSCVSACGILQIIDEINIGRITDSLKKWSESPTIYRGEIPVLDESNLPQEPTVLS